MLRSTLPAGWRHLCHVLCTYVDQDAGVILPRYQPSLGQLARDTGYHRRTIMRYLNGIETYGWVTRRRPTPADARTKHARTQYAIHIGRNPQEQITARSDPQARDGMSPGLGTGKPMASGGMTPELGTGSPASRGAMPHQSSRSSRSTGEEEIDAVIEAIKARAGVTVSEGWAARIAEQVLGARDSIRDPGAYLRRVIAAAPKDTYIPTPQPPRYTKAKGFER